MNESTPSATTRPDICDARAFLEDYRTATDMLALLESERQDAHWPGARYSALISGNDTKRTHWEERAREICRLLESLPTYREKMFLHYHYILGYSVEATAEAMDLSRSAAFRLKRRALELVAARLGSTRPLSLPVAPAP